MSTSFLLKEVLDEDRAIIGDEEDEKIVEEELRRYKIKRNVG